MANPSISLNEDTGDPSDFTLYTSDITDIVSQPTGQTHESNTSNSASDAPVNSGKASESNNNIYPQASKSNSHRTSTVSQRNRTSTQEHLNLHQHLMLQESDILMQHGLQIPGNIPMLPMNLWNPNMMGLIGVNDVMMNPSMLPPMPNFNQPMPMLQPELLMPESMFVGENHHPEQMIAVNKVPEITYPKPITPIRIPIDCKSCVVYPPSKGSSLPLVQKKPPGCRTIFVGGIPRNTTRMIIGDIFKRFGSISDIRLNNKFCHVRFEKGVSVDAALSLSGCRVTIGQSRHDDDSGLIFVDYSKAKDDMRDWEMTQQKVAQPIASVAKKERMPSPPPPPAVVHCSDKELAKAHKNMKQNDTFLDVIQLLNTWLDDGECDKKNIDRIFAILQNANGHVRRLNDEKAELIKNLMVARDQCKDKVRTISSQVGHIEGLFITASQQKVWDHFSKLQRKSLDDWKSELKKHKKAGPHNQSVLTKDNDDMDLSDDNKDAVDKNAMANLAKENIKLKHQLEAAKKAAESFKMEQIKEEKLKEEFLEKMQTSMKLFNEESQKAEAKIKELKAALLATKKEKDEFSKQENLQISKLKTENFELRQLLASGERKSNQISERLTSIQTELQKAKQEMFNVRETKLIGIIFSFLANNPPGMGFINNIVKHTRNLITGVTFTEIQSVLDKCPHMFKLEGGKGWTLNINTLHAGNASTATSSHNQTIQKTPENVQQISELSETPESATATNHTTNSMTSPSVAIIPNMHSYKEMRRMKFLVCHSRNKNIIPSLGFERRLQEFRGSNDPINKKFRQRLKTSETNIFNFTLPFTTKERLKWLRENVPIPEKYEEEIELEKQGLLPNFSDEEEEKNANDSSNVSTSLQSQHSHTKIPDISQGLVGSDETLNDTNILHTENPEISQDLIGSNETQNDVNNPPPTNETPQLKPTEAIVPTADSAVLPADPKVRQKLWGFSEREWKRLKFIYWHCRNNKKRFSPGLERRIQELRGPTESLKKAVRRRIKFNQTESFRFSIPVITEERLKWLKENVTIPEKFEEEIELEEQGLLPNFSDEEEEEESAHDPTNVSANPEISQDLVGSNKTQNIPQSSDVSPELIPEVENAGNETPMEIQESPTENFLKTPKGLARLSKVLTIFRSPTRWSPELRRILETLRPADCSGASTTTLTFPDGTCREIGLPPVTPEELKEIGKVVVPEKLPEEFIIEELSGIPASASKTSVKVEQGHKGRAVVNGDGSRIAKRKSSWLLPTIKTEPGEIIVIEDDDEMDRKEISVSALTRKRIKIEPTTDERDRLQDVVDSLVHIKNEPDDNKYNSEIPEQKSTAVVDERKEIWKESDMDKGDKAENIEGTEEILKDTLEAKPESLAINNDSKRSKVDYVVKEEITNMNDDEPTAKALKIDEVSKERSESSKNSSIITNERDDLLGNSSGNETLELCDTHLSSGDVYKVSESNNK